MLKKRNLIIRFGILFMLIGIVALSSGCSSKRMSKNHNRAFESYADMLDRLKISERERVLVDSITKLDEFIVLTDTYQKYLEKGKSVKKRKDAEKTKDFDDYANACSAVYKILDKTKLSTNASIAVFDKVYRLRK